MTLNLRPSALAGTWYPNDPSELAHSVDGYLDAATLPDLKGDVLGVIAPHAGYIYSGPVAGYAFAALRGRTPDVVVIVSPYHNFHPSPLLTSSHASYSTPLGEILVERDLLEQLDDRLENSLGVGLTHIARDREHSLEIELPFLQRALAAPFQILPIMTRNLDARLTEGLGRALTDLLRGKNHVLVASTDLSHFYTQKQANRFDAEMLKQIESFSPEGVIAAEEAGKGFACGAGAVASALWAARGLGADAVKTLKYATSGDVTGDYSSVVGYGAAAILRSKY
jgi:AmmeMemoRadiSam system protein B